MGDSSGIPSKDAKEVIELIDEVIDSIHVVIGGLAVQQYIPTRVSSDIDIICKYETVIKLVEQLFPTSDYYTLDENNDESRPAYTIKSRNDERKIVFIGPKILEREPYRFLPWDIFTSGSQPYKIKNKNLNKIYIPSAEVLAFTKLISFFSRYDTNTIKGLADIKDFCNLTNIRDFNINIFADIIKNTRSHDYIKSKINQFNKEKNFNIFKDSILNYINLLMFQENISSVEGSSEDIGEKAVYEVKDSIVFYNEISSIYDRRNSQFLFSAHQHIAKFVRSKIRDGAAQILDLGSGTGRMIATQFYDYDSLSWFGVDSSTGMSKIFVENMRDAVISYGIIESDLRSIEKYKHILLDSDIIMLNFVLTSMNEYYFLKLIIRLMKNEACFIISDIHPSYTLKKRDYSFSRGNDLVIFRPNPIYPDTIIRLCLEEGAKLIDLQLISKSGGEQPHSFILIFQKNT